MNAAKPGSIPRPLLKVVRDPQETRERTTNSLSVLFDLLVGEPNDPPTQTFDSFLPLQVGFGILIVIPAVDLNDELLGDTGEVRDIRANRVLALELRSAQLLATVQTPQQTLGGGRITSAPTCVIDQTLFARLSRHRTPSPREFAGAHFATLPQSRRVKSNRPSHPHHDVSRDALAAGTTRIHLPHPGEGRA
ncbi:hypothetical protein Mal65_28130 [Crateriforma conspicua]|nr:hypothetical protein Mal65_28130 [Crateriforma conspicua]